jgi:hypothetical protein
LDEKYRCGKRKENIVAEKCLGLFYIFFIQDNAQVLLKMPTGETFKLYNLPLVKVPVFSNFCLSQQIYQSYSYRSNSYFLAYIVQNKNKITIRLQFRNTALYPKKLD